MVKGLGEDEEADGGLGEQGASAEARAAVEWVAKATRHVYARDSTAHAAGHALLFATHGSIESALRACLSSRFTTVFGSPPLWERYEERQAPPAPLGDAEWDHLRRWCSYGVLHSWANDLHVRDLVEMVAANHSSTAARACNFSPSFRSEFFGHPTHGKFTLAQASRPFYAFCPVIAHPSLEPMHTPDQRKARRTARLRHA